jgi:hypothetical protein
MGPSTFGADTNSRHERTFSVRSTGYASDAFIKAITRHRSATRLTIDHVISNGEAGAVDGVVKFGKTKRAFCFVFEFASAKGTRVSGMSSYSIPLL